MEIKIDDYWKPQLNTSLFLTIPHQSCFLLKSAGLKRSFSHGDVSMIRLLSTNFTLDPDVFLNTKNT